MSTKDLHPGLGSGALREALEIALEKYHHFVAIPSANVTFAEARKMLAGILAKELTPLLSLSSPIEPGAEIANLVAFHEKETDVWAEQLVKARERIAELEAGAQASSEVREALTLDPVEQEITLLALDNYVRSHDWKTIIRCGCAACRTIRKLKALAPSRQGAAKRVEG